MYLHEMPVIFVSHLIFTFLPVEGQRHISMNWSGLVHYVAGECLNEANFKFTALMGEQGAVFH